MMLIDTRRADLYQAALNHLAAHKKSFKGKYPGRFVQIFLALKFYQNDMPSMFSGSFISTELFQSLLDDLYAKSSLPVSAGVLSLFENNHKARTGIKGPGNSGSQNTWRNNFNLQKGIGCFASAADLASPTFLNQPRAKCVYLNSAGEGLRGATCALCPTEASYRNEGHRKWLKIDPHGRGYATTDLRQIFNFLPYVAPSNRKIPVFPLMAAMYYDAALTLGVRETVSVPQFAADFHFSDEEMFAYFDVDPTSPQNSSFLSSVRSPVDGFSTAFEAETSYFTSQPREAISIVPEPQLNGTIVPPPIANTGWEAERIVLEALCASGWDAHPVARQLLGYDVYAQKGRKRRYVEVKSSTGPCSPSLTAREWQRALHYRDSYILAIIENFNPNGQNTIFWVPDPAARCDATKQLSISYAVPRGAWMRAVVELKEI